MKLQYTIWQIKIRVHNVHGILQYYIQEKLNWGAFASPRVLCHVQHVINKYAVNLETGIKKLPDASLMFSQLESFETTDRVLMLSPLFLFIYFYF